MARGNRLLIRGLMVFFLSAVVALPVASSASAAEGISGVNLDSNVDLRPNVKQAAEGQHVEVATASDISGNDSAETSNLSDFGTRSANADLSPELNDPISLARSHAGDLPDGTYTISNFKDSDVVLSARGGSTANGTPIQLFSSKDIDSQHWEVTHDSLGFVIFQNVKSGKFLDVPSGQARTGSKLQLYAGNNAGECNGTYAQKWIAIRAGDGAYQFVSALNPSLEIDAEGGCVSNGTCVQLYGSNGTDAQKWVLATALTERQQLDQLALKNQDVLTDGSGFVMSPISDDSVQLAQSRQIASLVPTVGSSSRTLIVHRVKDGDFGAGYIYLEDSLTHKVLDVRGGLTASATPVQFYDWNGTYSQLWVAAKNSDGTIKFVSALNQSLVLDCPYGSTAPGTNLQIYDDNGTAAQRWQTVDYEAMRTSFDELATNNRNVISDGIYTIVSGNLMSRKVLDVANGSMSNGGNIQLWSSNTTNAQRWSITHDKDGYLLIKNVASGKMLDVSGASVAVGTNVQQYDGSCSNQAQRWIAISDGCGGVKLLSAIWANRALDVKGGMLNEGSNIQIWHDNGTSAQTFYFVSNAVTVKPCGNIISGDCWYNIRPVYDGSCAIDIAGGQMGNGTNAQIYSGNETLSQLFQFEFHNGYYLIRNAGSGKVLDVAGGDVVPGTNVQLWAYVDGSDNQLYSVVSNEDGTYSFVNKATGLCLDVSGAGGSGSNLHAYQANRSLAQCFNLTEQKDLIANGIYTIASSKQNSALLDVAGGSTADAANVQVYAANDTFAQKWLISKVDGEVNTYTVESLTSAKRLSVDGGGNVVVSNANDSPNQRWKPSIDKDGIKFLSCANLGKALDLAGGNVNSNTNIQIYRDNGTIAQRFRLVGADASIPNGTYFIRMASAPNHVLDVSGGSHEDGANIQIWENSDCGAQKWEITQNGNGTYSIVNAASGKALDVLNGNPSSGANIQQWSKNGSAAQSWKIQYEPGGFKLVSSLNSSIVLDVSGGYSANGTNVQVYSDNNTSSQRFTFEPTTYIKLPPDQMAMYEKAQGYRSGSDWLILVDTWSCRVGIFYGGYGNWNLENYWFCSPGADATPTVLGQYYVTGRGYSFGRGYTCYYYTQFYGDYLFHSILYNQGTFTVQDGRLGQRLSHGCVRMQIDQAKWIYDNIPNGTKVVTY